MKEDFPMSVSKISSAILGIGVDDTTLDLFEIGRAHV